jgi:hypothetical protein
MSTEAGRLGDLDQGAGELPRVVGGHGDAGLDPARHRLGERRTIAGDGRTRPRAFAGCHDGNAVAGKIAADDDRVARADTLRLDRLFGTTAYRPC